jgi:hypothetical protein
VRSCPLVGADHPAGPHDTEPIAETREEEVFAGDLQRAVRVVVDMLGTWVRGHAG